MLEGGPSLVKVSDEELERDGWADSNEQDDVLRGIERLQDAGARGAVVSRGAETTIASIHGLRFEVGAPTVVVVDGRGGGDSMTGRPRRRVGEDDADGRRAPVGRRRRARRPSCGAGWRRARET